MVGVVSTLAGSGSAAFADGIGAAALFRIPRGIAVSLTGIVFVADTDNHRIRMIASSGEGALDTSALLEVTFVRVNISMCWVFVTLQA